ncbi:hypothetical protein OUZ56_027899 [Daphnia magna]|uniref:Uncharacterized protein n=1 Tax=Daphnia magna TaxID=35525 RepID=A0ABR0B293_9CRUS|nr:hypothetical protein OUZ56_027899 [Daphnia magna]
MAGHLLDKSRDHNPFSLNCSAERPPNQKKAILVLLRKGNTTDNMAANFDTSFVRRRQTNLLARHLFIPNPPPPRSRCASAVCCVSAESCGRKISLHDRDVKRQRKALEANATRYIEREEKTVFGRCCCFSCKAGSV